MSSKRARTFSLLFLMSGSMLQAQKLDAETELSKYRDLYPDEQAIFLNYEVKMHISLLNDSIHTRIEHYQEIMHLGDNSKIYAQDKIYSSSFNRVSDLNARTQVPVKKKYQTIPVTEFKESFDKDSYVFYDDVKYISFIYPAVGPGTKTQLSYTETISDPHFLTSYRFGSYLPQVNSSLTVIVDDGIDVTFRTLNDPEHRITSKEERNGSQKIYQFSKTNIPRLKFEEDAPSLSYEEAQVIPTISRFVTSEAETINVLHSVDDLYHWYTGFITDLKKEDEVFKALLSTIIKPEDPELEKVRKIFYWVQDNIKYIAFEQGMRGFIPHPGSYVLNNRYGDCKDMSSIIISLLHNAGIEGKFVWIGSRKLPYKYSELPSPLVDNHMIAAYAYQGKYYFLDATGQYTPFGFPTSMIQGKEALVGIDGTKYEISEVPVIPAEQNEMADRYLFSIENGHVKGSGEATLTGYVKVFNTYNLVKSNQKSTDDYITTLLSRGSNKFFVESYDLSNVDDRDLPIKLKYNFRVEDYYRSAGNDIYFNMNLDKSLAGNYIKEDRVHAIENEYKYMSTSEASLLIPEGYSIKFVPKNIHYESDVFSYAISYHQEEGKIVQKKEYKVDYLLLRPEQFKLWNEAIKSYSDSIRQVVILTKKG